MESFHRVFRVIFFRKIIVLSLYFIKNKKNINNIRNEPFFSPLQSNIGKELYEAKVISSLTMLEIYIYRKYSKITLTKGSIFLQSYIVKGLVWIEASKITVCLLIIKT